MTKHTGLFINREFTAFINGASEAAVILPGILALRIAFGIIDMLRWLVATQACRGNFKFLGSIPRR